MIARRFREGTTATGPYSGPRRPLPGEGFIAFVEELPGANTQGATLAEARANLEEAVRLVLEANRAMSQEDLRGADVIREPFKRTA
jgi:predicted RNase H-like HicB family nuclease